MYAGRKRRKPAQKGVKPTPDEGAKSNPSKRHRDRLNSELDRLASLLPFPEDVISSLDKLSILRLSVSYLRTKSFFSGGDELGVRAVAVGKGTNAEKVGASTVAAVETSVVTVLGAGTVAAEGTGVAESHRAEAEQGRVVDCGLELGGWLLPCVRCISEDRCALTCPMLLIPLQLLTSIWSGTPQLIPSLIPTSVILLVRLFTLGFFLSGHLLSSLALKNSTVKSTDPSGGASVGPADSHVSEGELLLQALNGFVLVVTAEGIIFFCSHTIQDYLGFHQTDVMHQSVFELIHTEDQQEFRRNLHWALNPPVSPGPPTDPPDGSFSMLASSALVSYNPSQLPPENSSFLERAFVCRFRCLLDNSSGFLALNIQGNLKFLHGQSRQQGDGDGGTPPQLALFAIATPLQPPAILEIRTRNMIFRTKHKLDFTPMACDAKGKIVLGYTEAELRVRGSGYQFIHAADMLYCAENHIRMIKTGESGLTVFRLLTKDNRWKWVQSNARLVYKNGKPDYIIATQRPLADGEGGEHLRKRSMHLPFTFATGEALLYQTGHPLRGFPDSSQGKAKSTKSKKSKVDKRSSEGLDPKSLLEALMSQDESVYVCQPDTEPKTSSHSRVFGEQQSRTDGLTGLFGGHSWSNGDSSCETSSFDPILATLDSLSLDDEKMCSNSELFSALENLGLNAEDLELLLLDQRMIQVELDPIRVPTLSDLLTNNEILSYIHASLETGEEAEDQGSGTAFEPLNPNSNQSFSQHPCSIPAVSQPIVQVSQQMQKHISSGEQVKAQEGLTVAALHPGAVAHWNHHHASSQTHRHPPTTLVNAEHEHLHSLLEPGQQWQLQQDSATLQSLQQDSECLNPFGPYLPNGVINFPPNVELEHSDYILSSTPDADDTLLNGFLVQDPGPYQSVVTSTQSLQLQGHQQTLVPSSPTHSSTLDLEQLMGLSAQQHSLPSLEAYSVFNTTQDPSHKVNH
ncbi:aryl hydrocarbon receptor-like [Pholidichthys leucotaenia]